MTFEARVRLIVLKEDSRYGTPSDLRVLDDYELCNRYRVLPEAGGLYDQDAELIAKFKVIDGIMAEKAKLEQKNKEMAERAKRAGGPPQ